MGRVSHFPCPDQQTSYDYFANKLGCETDPSDVMTDMAAGVDDFVLVDARSTIDFLQGHCAGAIHFPYREMDKATCENRLPEDKLIVTYCWGTACNAADKAAVTLAALGYRVKVMIGGFDAWKKEGHPVEGQA